MKDIKKHNKKHLVYSDGETLMYDYNCPACNMKNLKTFDEVFNQALVEDLIEYSIESREFIKAYILSLITSMSDEMENINLCSCTRVCYGHDVQKEEIKSIADKYKKLV